MEQLDVIKQLVAKYPSDLKWAVSSSDIGQILKTLQPYIYSYFIQLNFKLPFEFWTFF